jgi:hypothetical protein
MGASSMRRVFRLAPAPHHLEGSSVLAWQPCCRIPNGPRPVALRPTLSDGLPFSDEVYDDPLINLVLKFIL